MRAYKNKGATVAELVRGEDGYAGDGVGMFSHMAARSKQPRKSVARPQTTRQLIEIQERGLRELYAQHKAMAETDPRIVRLRRDIDAKQNFVAKLWTELAENIKRGRA